MMVSTIGASPLSILLTEVGPNDGGIFDYIARGTVGDQLTVVQYDDARTYIQHDPHQMLDHHNSYAAFSKLMNKTCRAFDFGAVQACIDFVEEQQLRLHGERLREFKALAHCQCQRCCGLSGLRLEANEREVRARFLSRGFDALPGLRKYRGRS